MIHVLVAVAKNIKIVVEVKNSELSEVGTYHCFGFAWVIYWK